MRLAKISTKKEKIAIERTVESVEVDFDFTQLYSCFSLLSYKVKKANSFKVLFYLLKNLPKDNVIRIDKRMIEGFIKEYIQLSGENMTVRYFYMCLNDLSNAEIVKKLSTSTYFLNPYVFWKDDKNSRIEYIRTDAGPGQTFAFNPMNLLVPGNIPEQYDLETMQDDIIEIPDEIVN